MVKINFVMTNMITDHHITLNIYIPVNSPASGGRLPRFNLLSRIYPLILLHIAED